MECSRSRPATIVGPYVLIAGFTLPVTSGNIRGIKETYFRNSFHFSGRNKLYISSTAKRTNNLSIRTNRRSRKRLNLVMSCGIWSGIPRREHRENFCRSNVVLNMAGLTGASARGQCNVHSVWLVIRIAGGRFKCNCLSAASLGYTCFRRCGRCSNSNVSRYSAGRDSKIRLVNGKGIAILWNILER